MTVVELGTEQVEHEAEIKNQPCVQQDEPASIFEWLLEQLDKLG